MIFFYISFSFSHLNFNSYEFIFILNDLGKDFCEKDEEKKNCSLCILTVFNSNDSVYETLLEH